MKNLVYVSLLVSLFVMASCGGGSGSSLPTNPYLGDLPAVIDAYQKADSILDAEGEELMMSIKSEKDYPKFEKFMETAKEREAEYKKKRDDAIEKLKAELIGRDLPTISEHPNYEVLELKVTEVSSSGVQAQGRLRTVGIVEKKSGLLPISFEARDKDNNRIGRVQMTYLSSGDGTPLPEVIAEGNEFEVKVFVDASKANSANFEKVSFFPYK